MPVLSSEKQENKFYARFPRVSIFDPETGQIYAKCDGKSLEVDNGLAGDEILQVDSEGYEYVAGINLNERKAKATITFGGNNFDISALQQNKAIETKTAQIRIPWKQQVLKSNYAPVTSGQEAFGMVADTPSRANTFDNNGNTIALVQQNFSSFNPNSPNSFAIGADFERKFSNDLVAARKFIRLQPIYETSVRSFSEIDLGYLSIVAAYFTNAGTLDYFEAKNAFVDVRGSGFKPGEKEPKIDFYLAAISSCKPYDVYSTNNISFCNA